MITFTYVDNSEDVTKSLAGFEDALADNTPALRAIADDFRELIARQFASEGGAEGTPWPPRKLSGGADIAPSAMSAKRKRSRSAGWPLLVRTGALRDSLLGPYAPGHVEEADERTLTLGSRLPYAIFHQTGTRHLPARPLIVLSDERRAKWTEILRGASEGKAQLLGAKELGATKL